MITVPYDSRSASPVYEIIPEKQHRSIIAYGRIPIKLIEEEVFRRVDLFEVASDEKCGQLAICIRLSEVSEIHTNNQELNHPQPLNVNTNIELLNIPRIVSASTSAVSEQAVESSVVLNELETKEIEVTEASEFNNSNSSSFSKISNTAATSKEDTLSVNNLNLNIIRSNSPVLSFKSKSSSRSSLAEDSDAQDEQELTEQMKIYNEHLLTIASQSQSQSTTNTTATQNSDRFNDIVGLLSLEIVAAQRLPREKRFLRSSGYCSNPFVTISFGKKSFRTKVKTNTNNPIWKEKLAFSVRATEMNYQVMFSVYDYESFGYNSCLATANIRTSHFIQNPEQVLKLAIPLNLSKQSFSSATTATIENSNSCCLLIRGSFLPYEKVRKNFWTKLLKAFDLNHSGVLCKLEFETMLESLGSTFSDSTIAKVFEAVKATENQEISIEEAVKVLEDLTVHPPNSVSLVSGEEEKEKIVILSHCPFCMKRWGAKQEEIDVITHLGICTASTHSNDQTQLDKFVMGGFLTEEYASRKWFARFLSFMSFGNYRIGRNNGNILVQDRRTGKLLEEKMPTYIRLGIRILHQNIVTYRTAIDFGYVRNIFQSLTIQQGKKFDHPSSVNNIPNFIKYHKIPVHEIADPLTSFRSFNEFFYRRIKLAEYRPLASPEDPFVTVSPADCRLNVFESVNEATKLWIKGINFSLLTLLKDEELAKYFEGGSLVIARLAPQDYHRYHSPVDGVIVMNYHIPGTYYTVNPMAVRQKVDVYTENARTVTIIDSPQFGKVAYVSIGAMMVGSIKITPEIGSEVKRLSEIGYFAFGGSTIVLLYSKAANVEFDQDLLKNSRESLETLVKVGESMGRKRVT